MASSKRIRAVTEMVLDTARTGAMLTERDDNTLLVTNVDSISQLQLDAIQDEIPTLTITLHQCRSSSSGFCIVLANTHTPHPVCTSDFFEIMCAACVLMVSSAMVSVA